MGSGQCHSGPRQSGCQTLVGLRLWRSGWLPVPGRWPVEVGPWMALQTRLCPPPCSGLPGTRKDAAPEAEAGPPERVLAVLREPTDAGHGGRVAFLCPEPWQRTSSEGYGMSGVQEPALAHISKPGEEGAGTRERGRGLGPPHLPSLSQLSSKSRGQAWCLASPSCTRPCPESQGTLSVSSQGRGVWGFQCPGLPRPVGVMKPRPHAFVRPVCLTESFLNHKSNVCLLEHPKRSQLCGEP